MDYHLNTCQPEELLEENKKLAREIKRLNRQLSLANDNIKKYHSVSTAKENVRAIIASEKLRQEMQLRAILDNSPNIIILLDPAMNILLSTKSFTALVGIEGLGSFVRKSFRDIFSSFSDEAYLERMETAFRKALQTNNVQSFDEKLCIGGSVGVRNYAISVVPFAYEDDQDNGLLVYFHDMTERIEMEDRIREALRDATVANKAKSDFLANMSHEIRTPMNAIQGMSELIMRESISDTVMSHVTDIKSACVGLLAIINDILDISKVESGRMEIVPVQYRTSALLTEVIHIIRARAFQKSLDFVVNIDPNIPSVLRGDEVRIKQVLINLLSNAVKFTHDGQITLSVGSRIEGDVCHVSFSVSDTGIGIKPEDSEKIFVLFQQIDTKRNRNIEGTGLGLSLTKKLTEMMGGSIKMESEYGVGSTFTATIEQIIENRQPAAMLKHGERKPVLVCENRPAPLSSITCALDALGCEYHICVNRTEMQGLLNQFQYSHIFVYSLFFKLVQHTASGRQPKAKIVILNDGSPAHGENNVPSISMPIHCLEIADILNDESLEIDSIGEASNAAGVIAPTAKVLVVDDNVVNLKVAEGLLKTYKIQVDTAFGGAQALEMVKETDYDLVFMDHMMPDMDGIDTTIAIRGLGGRHTQLPIIALSANAISGVKEMFIAEGLDDFLPKPIDMAKLDAMLKKWLTPRTERG